MKKFMILLLCVGFVTTIMGTSSAENIKWRVQSAFSRGDFSADLLENFAEEVREKTNNQMEIAVFYAGDLVPGTDVLRATSRGTIQMGQGCGSYWKNAEPILSFEAGPPFMYEGTLDEIKEMIDKTGIYVLWEEAYKRQNCHLLGIHTYGPYPAIVSNKPIRNLQDFKGLKVRAILTVADLFKELGASPGYIPGGEIYMALQRGTFDAATYSIDAVRGFNWHEVMDYYILPYWRDYYFGDIFINRDAWNSLSPELKKVLEEAMINYAKRNEDVYENEKQKIIELQKELGYEVITLSDKDVAKMRDISINKIWPKFANGDKSAEIIIEKIKNYRKIK